MADVIDMVPKKGVYVMKRRRGLLDVAYGVTTASVAGFIGHFFIGLPFWSSTAMVSDNATLMVAAFAIAYFLPK